MQLLQNAEKQTVAGAVKVNPKANRYEQNKASEENLKELTKA